MKWNHLIWKSTILHNFIADTFNLMLTNWMLADHFCNSCQLVLELHVYKSLIIAQMTGFKIRCCCCISSSFSLKDFMRCLYSQDLYCGTGSYCPTFQIHVHYSLFKRRHFLGITLLYLFHSSFGIHKNLDSALRSQESPSSQHNWHQVFTKCTAQKLYFLPTLVSFIPLKYVFRI